MKNCIVSQYNIQNQESELKDNNYNVNFSTNPLDNENSTILNHNKLYNCQQDIHQKKMGP